MTGGPPAGPGAALAASFANPFTTGAFFVMAGYYLVYYTGLLRNHPRDMIPAAQSHEKPGAPPGDAPGESPDRPAKIL